MIKKSRFHGIIWLLLFTLSACVPQSVTPQDIIGLWMEQKDAKSNSGLLQCASFEFFANGRFEAKSIPPKYFIAKGIDSGRVNTTGRWEIDVPRDPFAYRRINLHFDPFDGYVTGVDSYLLMWFDSKDILFAQSGNESNRISFSKSAPPNCK